MDSPDDNYFDFTQYVMLKIASNPDLIMGILFAHVEKEDIQDIETGEVHTFNRLWVKTDHQSKGMGYLWISIAVSQEIINDVEANSVFEPNFIDAVVKGLNDAFVMETLNKNSRLN